MMKRHLGGMTVFTPFLPRKLLFKPAIAPRARATPRGCCRFCSPAQSCTAATNTTDVTNGCQENMGFRSSVARAGPRPRAALRCAALRWRWSMPVPPQASTLIPGESPAIGRERSAGGVGMIAVGRARVTGKRCSVFSTGISRSTLVGRHGKKSMVPNIHAIRT